VADVLGAVRLSRMADESTSVERQREQIATWSRLHSHTVAHITEDTDVSGAVPAFARPGLGPWLTDSALSARWSILVVSKLDRCTRSVADLCDLIDYCQANGKVLVSIAESFDLGTPAGRMVATILASVAAFERERTAERRKEAAAWLRKNARYAGGGIPFGYQPEELPAGGWRLVPDPEEAALINRLADDVIRGRSLMSLCAELTEVGVPTSKGRERWHATTLARILKSPMLIGQIPYNGTVARDDDGVVVRRQPILTDEKWSRVQSALARSSTARTSARSSPMIGVLFCALCGQPMHLLRRNDRPNYFYRCGGRRLNGCQARHVPQAPIEDMITSGLLDACGDVQMADEVVIPGEDHTAELAAVEEALSHMEDQLVGGDVSPEAWGRAVARLEKRQAQLRAQPQVPARSEWVLTGKTFARTWAELNEDGRRALLVANGVTVRAERLASVGTEDLSVPIHFHDLARTEESKSDILILRRDDVSAVIRLGNLDRLRHRLARASA
jgi:site-specific DNA recombinase